MGLTQWLPKLGPLVIAMTLLLIGVVTWSSKKSGKSAGDIADAEQMLVSVLGAVLRQQHPPSTVECKMAPSWDTDWASLKASGYNAMMVDRLSIRNMKSCVIRNLYVVDGEWTMYVKGNPAEVLGRVFTPPLETCSQGDFCSVKSWQPRVLPYSELKGVVTEKSGVHLLMTRDMNFKHHGHMLGMHVGPAYLLMHLHNMVTRDCKPVFMDGPKHFKEGWKGVAYLGDFADRFQLICDHDPIAQVNEDTTRTPFCKPGTTCVMEYGLLGVGGLGFHSVPSTHEFRRAAWMGFRRAVEASMAWGVQFPPSKRRLIGFAVRPTSEQTSGFRTESYKRVLLNQDEIHQTLVKAFPNDNVFAVTFEHSLKEQVEMLHRLDVLISVEGSAIENVIFARRGLGVVILGYFYGDREGPIMHAYQKFTYNCVMNWCPELNMRGVTKYYVEGAENFNGPLTVNATLVVEAVRSIFEAQAAGVIGSWIDNEGRSPYPCDRFLKGG